MTETFHHHDEPATESQESAIVPSVSIENLTRRRNGVVDKLRQAAQLIEEARRIAGDCKTVGFPRVMVQGAQGVTLYAEDKKFAETMIRDVDAVAWGYLMEESGIKTFMDAAARRDWSSRLYQGDIPELTRENIESTFAALYESRGDLFERGVIAVYRRLSFDYKTNNPIKFGKRLILTRLASTWGNGYLSFNDDCCNALDDLERVCHLLDTKPEPDHRNGWRWKLVEAERSKVPEIASDYMSVRWFKKGTGHVTFKRLDLVDQLNTILAKHHPNALPCV